MKISRWIKTYWMWVLLISLLLIFGIPLGLDKIFSSHAPISWLGVHYTVGEILSFYGTVLGGAIGGVAALLAVYFTVKYYLKKDLQMEKNSTYEKHLLKINKVIEDVRNRDVVNYDLTLALGFSKDLLSCIISYNEFLCRLKGFFVEYGMEILSAFQCEYNDSLNKEKLSSNALKKAKKIGQYIQQELGMEDHGELDQEVSCSGRRVSVIEFLNLKPELRQCAEKIGHLALYDNACDLIHSDPTLSYILEIEGGGSAGLWAAMIHDPQGAFSRDSDMSKMWEDFSKCVRKLLIKLDEYKNSEYNRIVIRGDTSIVPKYYIKRAGSFMREVTTVEEYYSDDI